MSKNKIIGDTAILNIALLISQILAVLQSFLIMKFLDPIKYGNWLGFMLLLNYGSFAHLGIVYGMIIKATYFKEQNNIDDYNLTLNTGYFSWTFLTTVIATIYLIYNLIILKHDITNIISICSIFILLILEQQTTFKIQYQTALYKNFKMMSISNIYRAILSFIILLPMAYYFNVIGVVIGSLVVSFIIFIYWEKNTHFKLKINISRNIFLQIFKIGFPTLIVVLTGALILNIDRVVILKLLGNEYLGYYGLTALGGTFIYGILSQAGSTIGPHIVSDYAKFNESPFALKKYLLKPTFIFSHFSIILIILLFLIIPIFVNLFLHKYQLGITAFYFMIPGFYFLSLILTATNIVSIILVSKKKQRILFSIQFLTLLIEVLLSILFIKLGYKIEGVAFASTIASAFYGITILNLALSYVIEIKLERLKILYKLLEPFIFFIIYIIIYNLTSNYIAFNYLIIYKSFLTFSICTLLLYSLNKKTNFFSDIKPFLNEILVKYKFNK
jgi:O-antigen/teichoic acid export membrane protein